MEGFATIHYGARRLLSFLAMYLLLFGAKFQVLDISVFFAVMFAASYGVSCLVRATINKEVLLLTLYLMAMLSYFLLVSAISTNDVTSLVSEFGKMPLYLVSAAGLLELYKRLYPGEVESFILKDVFLSLVATAVLVVFLFMNPGVRNELYSLLDLYIFHGRDSAAFTNRIVDLSVGGSTVSLMLFFSLLFLNDDKLYSGDRKSVGGVVVFILASLAALLTGRTGLVLIVAYSLGLLCRQFLFRPVRLLKNCLVGGTILLLIFALGFPLVSSEAMAQFTDHIAPWAFELIYTYMDDGSISSTSGSVILDQYVSPDSTWEILVGGGSYDVPYDSAFVKLLHSVGLVGIVLCLFAFLAPYLWLSDSKSRSNRYLFVYMLVLLIGNIKETMLGNARGAIILYFVLLMCAAYSKALQQSIRPVSDNFGKL